MELCAVWLGLVRINLHMFSGKPLCDGTIFDTTRAACVWEFLPSVVAIVVVEILRASLARCLRHQRVHPMVNKERETGSNIWITAGATNGAKHTQPPEMNNCEAERQSKVRGGRNGCVALWWW